MAQIIKHRRGSITQLKDVTARAAEFVVATGSIGDLNGPFVFIGETEGVAGAYRPASKIYQGSTAPTISVGSHGSVIDGTPFYASSNKTLYILSKDGNSDIDLTGNIEGNVISGVTINNLTGLTGNFSTFVSASALNVTGNTQMGGTLFVDGNTSISGDLLITGNTYQTGSIELTGNIKLGGNINIGDATTDFVTFGAEVSSSIVPDVHNAFDLGSADKNWRDLHVSGTAYINVLEAQQVNFNDLGILTDLTVSGSTYLGNGGDITVVSGSLFNDQLTNNRVVIAGVDGVLEDDANFMFDGSKLQVGAGSFEVATSGNINTSGSLTVASTSQLKGAVGLNSTLDVTGSATLKSTLEVKGATGLDSTLDVTGSATLKSTLEVKGATGLDSTLDVTGSTVLKDTLEVKGATGLDSTLDVTGSATLKSTLEVKGATGLDSTLDVTGSATLKSTLEVKGAAGLNSSLDVTGSTTLKSTLKVNSTSELQGAVGVNSTLDVTGSAQFKSTINVDGEATLASAIVEDLTQDRIVIVGASGALIDSTGLTYNGTVLKVGGGKFEVDNADGDIRTSGSITTHGLTNNGDLTVNGVLTVTGNTQLQANLYVSGNLEVLGSSTEVHIQSQTIELDDNIIRLNAYSPFERYAGFEVMDSGSSGVSASLVWDSLQDYWMFVSSSGQSSKMIGTTPGTYGTEVSLTSGTFPIATSSNTIGNSLLTYSGTTLAYNTNKFTVDSGTGATSIAGNVTLTANGGADAGTNSSAILFRNSSNVVGYVSTTETTDVLDGILGYKNSDGALVFSTVIDGGSY